MEALPSAGGRAGSGELNGLMAVALVAAFGAGGVVALRRDVAQDWRLRAGAVAIGTVYAFVLAMVAGPAAVVAAPVLPFTGIGLADHLAEWLDERALRSAVGAAPAHDA